MPSTFPAAGSTSFRVLVLAPALRRFEGGFQELLEQLIRRRSISGRHFLIQKALQCAESLLERRPRLRVLLAAFKFAALVISAGRIASDAKPRRKTGFEAAQPFVCQHRKKL